MRSRALDTARGLAIVGVVFNHAVDGLVAAEVLDIGSPVAQVNAALYVFRMPALVFLVGLFIPQGVVRRGVSGYIRSRVVLLVYLYLVWQVLQGLTEAATSSVRNGSTGFLEILMVWFPLAHLWFLPFLALATVLVSPWIALPRRTVAFVAGAVALAAVCLVSWAAPLDFAGIRGIALVGFLAAGAALGLGRAVRLLDGPRWVWALIGAAASLAFTAMLSLAPYPGTVPVEESGSLLGNAVSIAAAALGVVALISVAVLISALPGVGSLFSHLGRYTLAIYLAHIVVVAGGRIVLAAVGVEEPYAILAVVIPLGVGIPYALARLAPKVHLGWLFALPRPLERWSASGSRAPRHAAAPTGAPSRRKGSSALPARRLAE